MHIIFQLRSVKNLGTQGLDSIAQHTERMEQNHCVYSGMIRHTGRQSAKVPEAKGLSRNQGPKNTQSTVKLTKSTRKQEVAGTLCGNTIDELAMRQGVTQTTVLYIHMRLMSE